MFTVTKGDTLSLGDIRLFTVTKGDTLSLGDIRLFTVTKGDTLSLVGIRFSVHRHYSDTPTVQPPSVVIVTPPEMSTRAGGIRL